MRPTRAAEVQSPRMGAGIEGSLSSASSLITTTPTLIGRQNEMDQLIRALSDSRRAQGRCIFLSGEVGVGKSRILAELARIASLSGVSVLRGYCFEQDVSFPYAPWIDALRNYFAHLTPLQVRKTLGPLASGFVSLLPELNLAFPDLKPAIPLEPEAEKRRLFEMLAQFFTTLASTGPLLVIVEDLHWSDEVSLDLLHFLTHRLVDLPVLLIASYRTEEVPPQLVHLLAQLSRERRATDIALRPLDKDDVVRMIRAVLVGDQTVATDLLNLIVTLTEGNPFFIEESLKALIEAGDIRYVQGRWELKPAAQYHIPHSVQDSVRRRADQLHPESRRVLMLAAIAGRRFNFTLLREVLHLDETTLLERIKELIAAQLVIEASAEEFEFRHTLTQQAITYQLLARERKILHQAIAETTESLYAAELTSHLGDLAYHFYNAGAWEKALVYGQMAGERAQALYAPRVAFDHLSHAMDATRQLSVDPPPSLLNAWGKACEFLGDFASARTAYEGALGAMRSSGDVRGEWQTLLNLGFLWAERDFMRSGDYLLQALASAEFLGDPAILALTLNRVGNWNMNLDRPIEGKSFHERALSLYKDLQDKRGTAQTLELLSIVNFSGGDMLQGTYCLYRAILLMRELGDREGLVNALVHRFVPVLMDTEVSAPVTIQQVMTTFKEALDIARDMVWPSGEAHVLTLSALALCHMGEYGPALEAARAGLSIAREIGHQSWMASAGWALGKVHLKLYDLPAARSLLEEALVLARSARSMMFIRLISAELASVCILQRDFQRAAAALDEVLDSEKPDSLQHRRVCWASRAELALACGEPLCALEIAEGLLAATTNTQQVQPFIAPRVTHIRGRALAALGRLDEAEVDLRAAAETAQARGLRDLLWHNQVELGHLMLAKSGSDVSLGVFTGARKIIEELAAGIPDPMLRSTFLQHALAPLPSTHPSIHTPQPSPGGLTEREREVVAYIAQGKTNREIAATMVVTVRTVETHITRIFDKLNLSSRTQVATWAIEKGLATPANRSEK